MNKLLTRLFAGILVLALVYGVVKFGFWNAENNRKRRAHDLNLARAQQAAEEGKSFGTPLPNDPGRWIQPKMVEAGNKSRAGEDRYVTQSTFIGIRDEIKALGDSSRKDDLFYALAFHQATAGLHNDAFETAGLIQDNEKRIGYLLAAGSNHIKDKTSARDHLLRAQTDIGQIPDATHRDSFYAQLAFAQHTRGFVDDQRNTCNAISSPEFKKPSCAEK